MIRIIFGFIWMLYKSYSKLIGWIIEGNKYAAAGGDQAYLEVVLW